MHKNSCAQIFEIHTPRKFSGAPDKIIFFTIAEKEPQYYETVRDGQRKKIYESLSHSHHYHLRYQLLPHREDQDAKTFKTDMVVFGGVVSKIYTDVDTRVLQGWPEESVEKGEDGNPVSNLHKYCWRHRYNKT